MPRINQREIVLNRNLIKQVILKTEIEYQSKVLNKEIKNEEFTTSSLVEEKQNEIKAQTVEEFYLHLIEELRQKGQIGNSYAYLNSYNTLKNFNNGQEVELHFQSH